MCCAKVCARENIALGVVMMSPLIWSEARECAPKSCHATHLQAFERLRWSPIARPRDATPLLQVPDTSMAYWDMGSTDSRNYGLPSSLTDKYIELDGEVPGTEVHF